MHEFFASCPATNHTHLCVGAITHLEAEEAREAGLGDGYGYYLFVADMNTPRNPIEILGKFASEDAAIALCSIMGMQTYQDS